MLSYASGPLCSKEIAGIRGSSFVLNARNPSHPPALECKKYDLKDFHKNEQKQIEICIASFIIFFSCLSIDDEGKQTR